MILGPQVHICHDVLESVAISTRTRSTYTWKVYVSAYVSVYMCSYLNVYILKCMSSTLAGSLVVSTLLYSQYTEFLNTSTTTCAHTIRWLLTSEPLTPFKKLYRVIIYILSLILALTSTLNLRRHLTAWGNLVYLDL
jgi:hypothetical protein